MLTAVGDQPKQRLPQLSTDGSGLQHVGLSDLPPIDTAMAWTGPAKSQRSGRHAQPREHLGRQWRHLSVSLRKAAGAKRVRRRVGELIPRTSLALDFTARSWTASSRNYAMTLYTGVCDILLGWAWPQTRQDSCARLASGRWPPCTPGQMWAVPAIDLGCHTTCPCQLYKHRVLAALESKRAHR